MKTDPHKSRRITAAITIISMSFSVMATYALFHNSNMQQIEIIKWIIVLLNGPIQIVLFFSAWKLLVAIQLLELLLHTGIGVYGITIINDPLLLITTMLSIVATIGLIREYLWFSRRQIIK